MLPLAVSARIAWGFCLAAGGRGPRVVDFRRGCGWKPDRGVAIPIRVLGDRGRPDHHVVLLVIAPPIANPDPREPGQLNRIWLSTASTPSTAATSCSILDRTAASRTRPRRTRRSSISKPTSRCPTEINASATRARKPLSGACCDGAAARSEPSGSTTVRRVISLISVVTRRTSPRWQRRFRLARQLIVHANDSRSKHAGPARSTQADPAGVRRHCHKSPLPDCASQHPTRRSDRWRAALGYVRPVARAPSIAVYRRDPGVVFG